MTAHSPRRSVAAFCLAALTILAFVAIVPAAHAANAYTQSFPTPSAAHTPQQAQLAVSLLRYEPYPVMPGQWADVYVTIRNVGESTASNVTVIAQPRYPFDKIALVSGASPVVYGSVQSTKYDTSAGVVNSNTSQTIVHYKVHVVADAANDTYPLRIVIGASSNNVSSVFTVPITVQPVRTTFDTSIVRSAPDRTVIALQNSGVRLARAVTVDLRGASASASTGATSALIGDLASGDVTQVGFALNASKVGDTVNVSIGYTDIAGNRVIINRTLSAPRQPSPPAPQVRSGVTSFSDSKWVFGLLGLLVGLFVMILARAVRR